jgi:hypothetical protein
MGEGATSPTGPEEQARLLHRAGTIRIRRAPVLALARPVHQQRLNAHQRLAAPGGQLTQVPLPMPPDVRCA